MTSTTSDEGAKPRATRCSWFSLCPSLPRTLLLATAYASLSGLLFGYQTGVMGGALHSVKSSLDLSNSEAESVSSVFFIGLMVGSPFGGYACDRLGRRSSMLYMDGGFVLAAFIMATAPTLNFLLAGRFLAGCASGISLVAAVSYLAELASAEQHHAHRGALVSTVEASVSLGFLVAYVASYALTVSVESDEGWRLLFGAVGFLAALQWTGMRSMPESPVWLAEQGFHDKAHAALRRITTRGTGTAADIDVDVDDDSISDFDSDGSIAERLGELGAEMTRNSVLGGRAGMPEQRVPLEYGEVSFFPIEDCPSVSHYWRQAVIIAFLAVAEQFCGHINIMNYAPVIFAEEFYDYDEETAAESGVIAAELLTTTIILGLVKFVITTFVLFQVDKLGRRFLLKAGAGIVTVSLLFLAIGFSVSLEVETISVITGELEYSHTEPQKFLVLIGTSGVVAGYALSYGPISWLVTAELSPSSIRGRMLGFYTVLTHGSAAIVSYTFLSGQERHGLAFPFWLYFVFSLASFLFIYVAVPETGAVTGSDGEDVESLLDDMHFWSLDNPFNVCWCKMLGLCHICKKTVPEEMGRIDSCFDDVHGAIRTPGSSRRGSIVL